MDTALEALLELFLRLVAIPSPAGDERALADFVLAYLREAGLEPVEDDTAPVTGAGSGNIRVRIAGDGEGTPIVVAAHMDTVAVEGPIEAVVEGGVVRSAGDTILGGDDKAAVAVLLAVVRDLAQWPAGCSVEAVFSTSEEVGLRGARAMDLSALRARAGFVFDSAGPVGAVITRAPAQKTFTAEFSGVAAHAGIEPENGRSAVEAAARAVAAMTLGRIDDETTANVGVIRGGVAVNIVPETCRVEGEVRSHDDQKLALHTGRVLDCLQLGAGLTGVDVVTSVHDQFAAFSLADDALPVRIAVAALREAGFAPRLEASGGGSDVNVYNAGGLPSVNLSVGMEAVHTHDERLPVARLLEAYRVLHAIVRVASVTDPD